MKAIKTKPDCTLGFVKIPEIKVPFQGHSENVLRFSEVTKESLDGSGFSWFKEEDSFEAIGKLSEVTEEQAMELVQTCSSFAMQFDGRYGGSMVGFANYNMDEESYTVCVYTPTDSLQSAALSVGIEEKDFDKYLVIKL